MKKIASIAFVVMAACAFGAPTPPGGAPGDAGGGMPGGAPGGGPGGGGMSSGSFVYDSIISVTTNSDRTVSRDGLVYGYVSPISSVKATSAIKELAQGTFAGNTTLTSADLSASSIKQVPSDCFAGCTSLKTVVLPSSCTAVGPNAFAGCSALVSAAGGNIASVGSDAFRDCVKLTSAPTDAASIGECAFANCPLLDTGDDSEGGDDDDDCDDCSEEQSSGETEEPAASAHSLFSSDLSPLAATKITNYNCYVLDGDETVGTVMLKVGRANSRTGIARFSATARILGRSRLIYGAKAVVDAQAPTSVTLTKSVGGTEYQMDLVVSGGFVTGTVDGMQIFGSRNASAAKEALASAYAAKSGRVYNVALSASGASGNGAAFASGYSALAVRILSKGKAKVTGVMSDGTKVSVSGLAMLLCQDGVTACVPVVAPMYRGKVGGFGFLLWIDGDGSLSVERLSVWDASASASASFTAYLSCAGVAALEAPADGTLRFSVDADAMPSTVGGLSVDASSLPGGIAVSSSGGKLSVAEVAACKLRISRVASTGIFKGSFRIFLQGGASARTRTVSFSGVIIDGKGYGAVMVKNAGSAAVFLD